MWPVSSSQSTFPGEMETPRVRLGELLVRAGLITGEQLEATLIEQRRVGKRLGTLLVENGLVSESQVTQILSQQLSVPWVSLHHIDFSRQLLDLVPYETVQRFSLIPIYVRRVRGVGDALYVAMDDPTNAAALEAVEQQSGLPVRAMIAPPRDISDAIRVYYGVQPGRDQPPVGESPLAQVDQEADIPTGVHSRASLMGAGASAPSAATQPADAERPPSVPVPPRSTPVEPVRAAEAKAKPRITPVDPVRAVEASPATSRSSPAPAELDPSALRKRARKMVALTFLDGTTIQLPSQGDAPQAPAGQSPEASTPAVALTARDIVEALRAQSQGKDASEVLGQTVNWEAMFSALLSLLLKKHLIADWEFVEELQKRK